MTRRATTAIAAPLAFAAALCAGAATASTFDFGALADQTRKGGKEHYFSEVMSDGWTVDGITVRTSDNAWLDGGFRSRGFTSRPAGLGACNDPSGRCDASDYDGVRDVGERLSVMFDTVISAVWTLRETTAAWYAGTGPDHTLVDGCARVNGVERAVRGGAFVDGAITAASFDFEPCTGGGTDYYVTAAEVSPTPSPVPVPAGVVLLGTALAGLGWRARRAAR